MSSSHSPSQMTARPALTSHGTKKKCPISVWASQAGGDVYGYKSNGALCITLTGPGSSCGGASPATFNGPFGLATDTSGNLYVADQNNLRVVVFNSVGTCLKWFNLNNPAVAAEAPQGVCTGKDRNGNAILGVTNAAVGTQNQYPAEFFYQSDAAGSFADAYASGPTTGAMANGQFCAYDSSGNFFAIGFTGAGTPQIAYVGSSAFSASNTLVDSNIYPARTWRGAYSALSTPVALSGTLSVGAYPTASLPCIPSGGPDCALIYTWDTIGTGPIINFAPVPAASCTWTNYPNLQNGVEQIAPSTSTSPGNGEPIMADFGTGTLEKVTSNTISPCGGPHIAQFNTSPSPLGVATEPVNQY